MTNESGNADNGREAARGIPCESEGGSRACIDELAVAPRGTRRQSARQRRAGRVSAPLVVVPTTGDGDQGTHRHPDEGSTRVAPRAPVRVNARPSVGEGMIPERAGCGKPARPVRRAATGNGVGLNRVRPAHHRASRRLYPRAAMIAEDPGPVRVLATESIAGPTFEGACARTGPGDPRGRGQRGPRAVNEAVMDQNTSQNQ